MIVASTPLAQPSPLQTSGRRVRVAVAVLLLLAGSQLFAQYDKIAGLGSDSARVPIGGPASAPLISTDPYNAPDLRPVGELNDHLPKWIQFGFEERFRFEGYDGNGFKPGVSDSYLLNRFRWGVIVRPARWFRMVGQVQDARGFLQTPPIGPPNTVRWDLKLAYAELGDPETQPVTFRVGRQTLDYNNTIISDSQWKNQGRSFDAAVANFHFGDFRSSLFAASVVNPLPYGVSHHAEGNNIYGWYNTISRVVPKSIVEPFVLWRVSPAVAVEAGSSKTGHLSEQAYGLRVAGRDIRGFDYRAEYIREGGDAGSNTIGAWATTLGAGYTLASLRGKPRFFTGYDYASGDRNPTDGRHGAFDTMYPTAHDRFGTSDQFGWQNIMAARGGVTVVPHRRWSVTAQYLDFWLASATDALYNTSGGAVLRDVTGKSGTHIGNEVDGYTWYEINREVQVGVGIAHVFPGEFINRAGKGGSYTYPYFAIQMLDGKRVR